jgi:hypothetical protein
MVIWRVSEHCVFAEDEGDGSLAFESWEWAISLWNTESTLRV